MQIEIGSFMLKPHNDLCWEVFEWRMTEPNAHNRRNGAVPEEKWCSLGKYPSTIALALQEVYELSMKKGERGVYELKDALAAAKRIERSIERAAKASLEGGAE